jgi:HlyD family secretion protein
MNRSNLKRLVIIGGVALLLAAATVLLTGMGRDDTLAASDDELVTVIVGDLAANATASGTLLPQRESTLSAGMPGRVEAVHVETGDYVQAGEALMQLETSDLAQNVSLSKQNVRLKEANLAELEAGASEAQLASAEATLASAQAQLDELLAGPSAEELAALEAELKAAEAKTWSSSAQVRQTQNAVKEADIAAAEAALRSAQANLTSVEIQYTRNPDPDDVQANSALAQAREQLAAAQARLDALLAGPDTNQLGSAQAGLSAAEAQQEAAEARYEKEVGGPTAAELAAAEAQVAQAQANLAALADGPTVEQIMAAEAELAQAGIDLASAEAALAKATIRAPFAGLITDVYYVEGELANGPVVSMFAADSLEVVLEVDEADVASLELGQTAEISLEAFPGVTLTGEISAIAPKAVGTAGSSLVAYQVRLALIEQGLPLRSGMTADAHMVVAERQDVLLVPNQAIHVDRASGSFSVNLVSGDTVAQTPVVIGLRDGQYTQVVEGLEAGDQVLLGNALPVESVIPTPRVPFGGQ